MPDGTAVIITEEAGSMTHVIVRSYARAVRLFAIVDALIIILYVVSGFYAAVALLRPGLRVPRREELRARTR